MESKHKAKTKAADFALEVAESLDTALNNLHGDDDLESEVPELHHLQRASLNGGRAKQEHNKIHNEKIINSNNNDDDIEDSLANSFIDQM